MKKFFALMLVVAMLSVTGSAMAVTLSASSNALTVTQGTPRTVTFAPAATRGGTLSTVAIAGPAWATINGNTLTLNPTTSVAAGGYTVIASVTETYAGDVTSHGTRPQLSETATWVIDVAVAEKPVAGAGTQRVITVVETPKIQEKKKEAAPVVSVAAQKSASVLTFADQVKTVAQTFVATALAQIPGLENVAQQWENKATAVQESQDKAVETPEKRAALFPNVTRAIPEVKPTTSLQPTISSTSSTKPEEKLAAAAAELGSGRVALSAGEAVKATEAGTYSFNKNFGSSFFKTKIKGSTGRKNYATVSMAAVDTDNVAFLDSRGIPTDIIPGDDSADQIMPGYVNMLVVMEAGQTYEPVVFAESADVAAVGVTTESVSVDVNEVVIEKKTLVADVDESGNVAGETVVPEADATVTNNIKNTVARAISGIASGDVKEVPASKWGTVMSTTEKEAEKSYALSYDVSVASQLGMSLVSLDNGVHYIGITFEGAPSKTVSDDTFVFYPDGYLPSGTTARAWVLNSTGDTVITRFTSALYNQTGWLVFQIANGAIRTSDTNNTLDNPTLTVKLQGSTPPPVTYTRGTESSGGGCSAGSAALALAVLGSFILTRKK